MKTLEEVFRENLKVLRGKRTQADIAEAAGIPLRSYQHAESGIIPQGPNRAAIAFALGVPGETALFLDPDLRGTPMTPEEALEVLSRAIKVASDPLAARVSRLSPRDRQYVEDLVKGLESDPSSPDPSKSPPEKGK